MPMVPQHVRATFKTSCFPTRCLYLLGSITSCVKEELEKQLYIYITLRGGNIPTGVLSSTFKTLKNDSKQQENIASLILYLYYISMIIDSPIPPVLFHIDNTLREQNAYLLEVHYCIYSTAFPGLFQGHLGKSFNSKKLNAFLFRELDCHSINVFLIIKIGVIFLAETYSEES